MKRVTLVLAALGMMLTAPAAFAIEGDYNDDGSVDNADKAIILAALGKNSEDDEFVAAADHDGDGVISLKDVSHFAGLSK